MTRPEPSFGMEEILQSLSHTRASLARDGWFSVGDLVEAHGLHRQTVQKRLRELLLAGRLESSYSWREGLEGPARLYRIPVYRLKG